MLKVEIPSNFAPERAYILEVVLGDVLGLQYTLQRTDRRDTLITMGSGQLIVVDGLFAVQEDQWLTVHAMPVMPLPVWNTAGLPFSDRLVRPEIPILYGRSNASGYLEVAEGHVWLGVDVFGSGFFMLTRYEELVGEARDNHGRFPARASLAFREGFLDRPIINEYVEILWAALKHLWPGLTRRAREYRVALSHDVDWPLFPRKKPAMFLKACLADILKRRDWPLLLQRLRSVGRPEDDVYNCFDFIMDVSEEHGLASAFYFIADHTGGSIDGDYSLDEPWIQALLRRIHGRGHEIGLHASYNSYLDSEQTRKEQETLVSVCRRLGIEQQQWGGRQHFLRWSASGTWRNWDQAGLKYDSTLSYADLVGFRAGLCHEYRTFDLRSRRRLELYERPLIVMEQTLFHYLGLKGQSAIPSILDMRDRCRQYQGTLELLWHNSSLVSRQDRSEYRKLIPLLCNEVGVAN